MTNLDLRSTSQTDLGFPLPRIKYSKGGCIYAAPFFAVEKTASSGVWALSQGSCNHWDCPRCGVIRAKEEYWRIVQGSKQVVSEGHALWFITITTRGSGLKVAEAEENYLQWTNRLFTNLRTSAGRHGDYWCYVQVTERQRRAHPHSHILTTYRPLDLMQGLKLQYETKNGERRSYWQYALRSPDFESALEHSGMGEVYDISAVRSVESVSRYVAKYLFKHALHTVWPKGWKRVRYSQNWPKNELPKTNAIALIDRKDWFELATVAEKVICHVAEDAEIAKNYLWAYPVDVVLKELVNQVDIKSKRH